MANHEHSAITRERWVVASRNVRTEFTDYNHGTDATGKIGGVFAFSDMAHWVLNTFGDQWVNENGHTAKVENCFEPSTEFLRHWRILLGDAASATGIAESAHDIVVAFSNDAQGNVAEADQRHRGSGDDERGHDVLWV